MSVASKLVTVAENQQKVYDAGRAKARQECAGRHYATVFTPAEDITSLVLDIDFLPDAITVMNLEKGVRDIEACEVIKMLRFSPTVCDIVGLHVFNTVGGSAARTNGIYTSSGGGMSLISKNADGTYTLSVGISSGTQLHFKGGCKHFVCAVREDALSDAEKLIAFVDGLSDAGGTAYVSQITVDNSDLDWEALMATKPSWTFVMK